MVHLQTWLDDTSSTDDVLIARMLQEFYGIGKDELPQYRQLVHNILDTEQSMPEHYVCYHAFAPALYLVFMLHQKIHNWLSITLSEASYRLRFKSDIPQKDISSFIDHWDSFFEGHAQRDSQDDEGKSVWNIQNNQQPAYEEALKIRAMIGNPNIITWNDTYSGVKPLILSVNLALFGNTELPQEGTFHYFIEARSGTGAPFVLDLFFRGMNLPGEYKDKFMVLYNKYLKPKSAGGLLQIFIPKGDIDSIMYLAHPYGTPYRARLDSCKFLTAKERHAGIADVLDWYEKPEAHHDKQVLNSLQARIVLLPAFLGNQDIKFRSWNFVGEKEKKAFEKEFDAMVRDMLAQWIASKAYLQLSEDKANQPLVKLLKYWQEGQKEK